MGDDVDGEVVGFELTQAPDEVDRVLPRGAAHGVVVVGDDSPAVGLVQPAQQIGAEPGEAGVRLDQRAVEEQQRPGAAEPRDVG